MDIPLAGVWEAVVSELKETRDKLSLPFVPLDSMLGGRGLW